MVLRFGWFIYLDDEKDPEEVDKDKSGSLGEERPSAKDGMKGGRQGAQGQALAGSRESRDPGI